MEPQELLAWFKEVVAEASAGPWKPLAPTEPGEGYIIRNVAADLGCVCELYNLRQAEDAVAIALLRNVVDEMVAVVEAALMFHPESGTYWDTKADVSDDIPKEAELGRSLDAIFAALEKELG